jgi:hypothetical protein
MPKFNVERLSEAISNAIAEFNKTGAHYGSEVMVDATDESFETDMDTEVQCVIYIRAPYPIVASCQDAVFEFVEKYKADQGAPKQLH